MMMPAPRRKDSTMHPYTSNASTALSNAAANQRAALSEDYCAAASQPIEPFIHRIARLTAEIRDVSTMNHGSVSHLADRLGGAVPTNGVGSSKDPVGPDGLLIALERDLSHILSIAQGTSSEIARIEGMF